MASPNELSFLPDDYLERKARRRTNVVCALLFLVVMIAIGTAFTITERSSRDLESLHAQVEQQYTEAAKRIAMKQELETKQATMERQAELSASLLEKVPRSFMLGRITNALPAGVSLLDLTMESRLRQPATPANSSKTAFDQKRSSSDPKTQETSQLQQAKVYDVGLKITGVAMTDVQVAQFIGKLNQLKLFQDVNLVISDEYQDADSRLRKFQLEAQLDPNVDISQQQAADAARTAAAETREN